MIIIRKSKDIYQASGRIENGTFQGKWHFSFDEYYDPNYMSFGKLRVFNDDTLSPGAIWPLHPHRDIEVVTYCAQGEFRHADQTGLGGILKKGWAQHTTVGEGIYHSEINNSQTEPMRFIQMWFIPNQPGLTPSVEQKQVEKQDRTNILLPLISNDHEHALKIQTDAAVYASFLQNQNTLTHNVKPNYGAYLYILEGGPVTLNKNVMNNLDAALIKNESELKIHANQDAELLLVSVSLIQAH